MAAAAHDPPSTFGNLGYFHLRFIGPSPALLVLRSDRLYSLSISRRRGHCLCLLLDRPRRRRAQGLLLNTSGCKLRLTHRSTDAGGGRVNGRPLRAGAPAELVVGDEVSLVRYGASYVFVVESFVSCRGGEGGAAAVARSREEGIVLRAESLRKRLRAISESEDPLSFFRDPYSSGNGTAVAGVKESRPDTDAELSQNHPIGPDSEVNLLRENCNLEQDKLEHHTDVVHDDVADLCHESNGCGNGSVQQNKFTNVSEEQYHNEGCYSDGSTFFLNRLEKHILHRKSARRILLGSVQTSVVGISHRFHIPSDAGSKLKALSAYLGKCRVNMHGSTEVILKRNTNIPADANAVLSKMKWPETLETDFIYSASSIGTSINPQFIASFASAAGKRSNQDLDSQESDPEWGCWIAKNELKKPSISVLFPTIERVKQGACGIQLSRYLLSLPEKTWQRLRSTGIFHDAIPHPDTRVGHPMHVKVARRRFESSLGGHSFGWTYCGSHNFSPAAWGQLLSPPSKVNPVGSRAAPCGQKLHICNYELGIILISPPPGMSKHASKRMPGIDDISLPFVVPPPRYTQNDRPATPLAMREVMAEACVLQSNGPVDLSEETDEDTPDEEDEHVVELSDCSQEEKEEEKIYAETLWEQVYSSQSQEKD
ncbi:hypothetical protein PR202_ga20464 [Eleusine coracana subsp. coracana]|uniref:FHA domain-containing protein n=1 Tax=Eleusine coracana subsp. coracana TaxID=191504 RepID=A0AAV5CY39_ELECO|nr:hypothetical protein PR202_ga20464 [Eleusine coracana subsp. coracana]